MQSDGIRTNRSQGKPGVYRNSTANCITKKARTVNAPAELPPGKVGAPRPRRGGAHSHLHARSVVPQKWTSLHRRYSAELSVLWRELTKT